MESVYIMTLATKSYKPLPGGDAFIVMKNFENQTVWKNSACRTYHLGDDVLDWNGIPKWEALVVKCWKAFKNQLHWQKKNIKGLVIANEGPNLVPAPM